MSSAFKIAERRPTEAPRAAAPSVLYVLQPPDGGVAEHVLRLALGLRAQDTRVEVATAPDSRITGKLQDAGVPVHLLPMGRAPGVADLRAAQALRALDRRVGAQLVHAHSSKAGALVRAALPDRRRLLYTPHCFAFLAGLGPRRTAYRAVEQALVARSAAIVAVCEWERRAGERALRGAAGRLRVIRNGVPAPRPADPDRDLLAFRGDRPLAGLVAVLRPQKDPLALVRAAGRMPLDTGRVAIVGDGALAEPVRQEIARLGLTDRVRWFPYAGDPNAHLAALDVFVLSSAWEALPLGALEAMARGLPVIATDVGGVAEAVRDGITGRLVAPGDLGALANALGELLGNADARRRLGAAGRDVVAREFGVERMVGETAALYAEVAAR
jgi:glycosyltransferase involved in cell wall biosynthesis